MSSEDSKTGEAIKLPVAAAENEPSIHLAEKVPETLRFLDSIKLLLVALFTLICIYALQDRMYASKPDKLYNNDGSYAGGSGINDGEYFEHRTDTRRYAKMPRTSDRDYNTLLEQSSSPDRAGDKKYFLFQMSGGFNNQRMIMERALEICHATRRVCVMPMAGKHTSMWQSHYELKIPDMVPMDKVIDFNFIEQGFNITLLPLNVTMKSWIKSMEEQFPPESYWKTIAEEGKERKRRPIRVQQINDLKRNCNKKFLYFAAGTMWQPIFPNPKYVLCRRIRMAPFFRRMALRFAKTIGRFNAVHLRLGDYTNKVFRNPNDHPSARWVDKLTRSGFPDTHTSNVYVATEPMESYAIFDPMIERYNVTFGKDLDRGLYEDFSSIFELPRQEKLRNDMFGLVEQLICCHAVKFVGTAFSTFTAYIRRMRSKPYHDMMLPESVGERINTFHYEFNTL